MTLDQINSVCCSSEMALPMEYLGKLLEAKRVVANGRELLSFSGH
jgi:hypothetical protein